ncbi:GNAT family N-acetyltransferase [soil metagenome]
MTIREATGVDLAAIDDIYNHYVRTSTATFQVEPTTPAQRRAWFEAHGPDHPVIVFEEEHAERAGPRVAGGRIAGWASLNPYGSREGYARTVELSVYVRHDRHRRGVGRALLDDLVVRARALGHHVVLAMVAADQEPSLALHRRCGFRDVGRLHEVGFKLGRWLDVVLLDQVLPDAPRRELT